MHLFKPGEGLPLEPSICIICEASPQSGAVDTFRTNDTHVPTKLRGRKYVCCSCIEELGQFIGMASAEQLEFYKKTNADQSTTIGEQWLRIEQLEAVHVETLRDLLKKATKPQMLANMGNIPNGG